MRALDDREGLREMSTEKGSSLALAYHKALYEFFSLVGGRGSFGREGCIAIST